MKTNNQHWEKKQLLDPGEVIWLVFMASPLILHLFGRGILNVLGRENPLIVCFVCFLVACLQGFSVSIQKNHLPSTCIYLIWVFLRIGKNEDAIGIANTEFILVNLDLKGTEHNFFKPLMRI